MNSEIEIASGLANLWLRMPLVLWLSLIILLLVDRRKNISASWVALSASCVAASFHNWADNGSELPRIVSSAWLASFIAALLMFLLGLRNWTSSSTLALRGLPIATLLSCASCFLVGFAVMQPLLSSPRLAQEQQVLSIIHLFAAATGLATALVCGLELTFLSSPDSLKDSQSQSQFVWWRFLSWCALLPMCTELLVGVVVFSFTAADSDGLADAILVKFFIVSLLVTCFVAWMVPHRTYKLQQQVVRGPGSAEATSSSNWTSLTLAAWLAAVSFVVVCALPDDWPWRFLEFAK